jgi:hypothetical protein
LAAAFHCDVADVGNIDLERDPIEYNGHRHSKKELSKFVADGLTTAHGVDPEVETFVNKLRTACK